jgi:hypothetical protein
MKIFEPIGTLGTAFSLAKPINEMRHTTNRADIVLFILIFLLRYQRPDL